MSLCFLTKEKMKIYVCIYRKMHPSSNDVCRSLVKSLRYIANKICIFCSHIPGLYICHYLSVRPFIRLSVSSEMCQMVCIRCLINMLFATNWLTVSVYKKNFESIHTVMHFLTGAICFGGIPTPSPSPITSQFRVPRLGNLNSLDTQHMSTTH